MPQSSTVSPQHCSVAGPGPATFTRESRQPAPHGSAPAAAAPRRWSAPARGRVRTAAVASPAAPAATRTAGGAAAAGTGTTAARPPSPSLGGGLPSAPNYFEGFCPEQASECSPVWSQLRWCSTWQQMRHLYDSLLRAEAEARARAAEASAVAAAALAAAAAASAAAGSNTAAFSGGASASAGAVGGGGGGGGGGGESGVQGTPQESSSPAAAASAPAAPVAAAPAPAAVASARSSVSAPGLLSRDETYAFLLQLQDFYHDRLDERELAELQAFRCRLVRDLSVYVRALDAEQLEALCCASAVSGQCLTRERADAVQERLLRILTGTNAATAAANGNGHANGHANGNGHASGNGSSNGNGNGASRRRPDASPGDGFGVLTPALNTIFALYDHGYLPHVALLQAVFRTAVDHCCEVTRSQWHGLHGLARKFRFLLDEHWLDDLHACLRDPLACSPDLGRMASVLGCVAAFTVNGAMEALDTRVLVVVEAIERRYDEGRSLLSAHQLCVFAALLTDMRSPFRTKWLAICRDHLASCSSHVAALPPATLLLAVELVLRDRGWEDTRLLSRLLRRLFATYPATTAGTPLRAASRIISAASASSSSSAFPPPPPPSLAALAAAAAWDVELGRAGGAASPPLDLASIIDWLAAKVPSAPGPDRDHALAFLRPLVSELVESGRSQLPSLAPRRIPGLIRGVLQLGYGPSREWVAEAFGQVGRGAGGLSGGELVAMLRLSHAARLPLPSATLDAVCAQHGRILPLMRAVDLQRLLECWVEDRYIPSREQLEGFFDAVCDAFGIDLLTLKAATSASASRFPSPSSSSSTSPSASIDGECTVSGSGAAAGSRSVAPRCGPSVYHDVEPIQTARGGMSAGSADGVTGGFTTPPRRQPSAPPPVPAAAAAASGNGNNGGAQGASPAPVPAPGPDSSAAAAPSAAASASSATVADAAGDASAADAAAAAARPTSFALSSLEGRPKGSLLQPGEAQTMLTLLDQYRSLLLAAKRSDLLVVMNTYRNAVTAALHDMRKAAGGARQRPSARTLQAVLRSGGRLQAPIRYY